MSDHLLDPVRPAFRAAAEAFVPEAARLDEAGWTALEDIVEHALARRPPAVRRQLRLFLRALDVAAVARHGRPLRRLDAAKRVRLLEGVQDAPLLLLRRGVWGLRTLVFMGYYARPGAAEEIGYGADAGGWRARGGDRATSRGGTSS